MQASHRGQGTRVPVSGERPEEELAFAVVRRVLGVPVERHDRDGRQGAVDALVRYPEGRPAALEVSSIGPQGEARIWNFLGRQGYTRAVPGLTRTWALHLPRDFHPADMRIADEALPWCDRRAIIRMRDAAGQDDGVDRLLTLGVRAHVLENAASDTRGTRPRVYVSLPPIGGFPGRGTETLAGELAEMLRAPKIQSKISKLAATGLAERHLVLIVRPSAFSYPVYDALAFGGTLPGHAPSLPAGLSQLWLLTGIREGGVVRAVAGDRWSRSDPFDPPPQLQKTAHDSVPGARR
jgi:hypothetical protein